MKSKRFRFALGVSATLLLARGSQPTFTKDSEGSIGTDIGAITGFAWGDFSRFGYLDLFVTTYNGPSVLYRNGYFSPFDPPFQKISSGAPDSDSDTHTSVTVGDYNNDGNPDLLISAGQLADTATRNVIYDNEGFGSFSVAAGGGLSRVLGYFRVNAWADYNNDGLLDFFIGSHGDAADTGGVNLVFHNNGDGTFTQAGPESGLKEKSIAYGVQWADYDNDGYMDLIVINNPYKTGNGVNFLYHNERNETFRRILTGPIATEKWTIGSNCAAWGDYNNDGFLDLFITANGSNQKNRLYKNDGDGTFTRITIGPMLTPPSGASPVGCTWGDYDNDGYLDLFITNLDGPNGLFHNNGDGSFSQVTDADVVNEGGRGLTSSGVSWVDYDNNGFLDLCFITSSDFDYNDSAIHLYHNDGNDNSWLEVKCVGTVSNRSAIGTKVRLKTTVNGKDLNQLREITSGGGQNVIPLVAHFGLGNATNVSLLRIEWPSGTVQEFANVPAGKILNVTEPPRLLLTPTNGTPGSTLKGGRGSEYDVQASFDLKGWSNIGSVIITNLNGIVRIPIASGAAAGHSFYRAISH